MRRRLVHVVMACALFGACANVIGANGRVDAVEELCKCTTLPDCENRLTDSLETATEAEVTDWLESYKNLGCATANCQDDAYRCFYMAPGLCEAPQAPCERAEACCGFNFDDPGAGTTCCVGDGDGACCETCTTCAELLGDFNGSETDDSSLCMSHRESWNAVLACAETSCATECVGPATCAVCVQAKCKNELLDCNSNTNP